MKFVCKSEEIAKCILSDITLTPKGRYNVMSLSLQIQAMTLVLYTQIGVTVETRKLKRDHWRVRNVIRRENGIT